jgi:hypothetical protein
MKTSLLCKSVFVASFLSFTAVTWALNVPKPMAIDIDDLGWKEGWDLHESGGPYRLGLPPGRRMTLPDYEVLVYISQAVGVRLKSLFIMSEFDRSNICARYPTTNEKGSAWDNSALVSDNDFAVMNYVKENAAHIEFGLHGVRHEFWDAQTHAMSRAEWADNGKKRPYDVLWGTWNASRSSSTSTASTFPGVLTAAANYYYSLNDPEETGAMSAWGVKYATCRAGNMTDHGLMVLLRPAVWPDAPNSAPKTYPETEFMTSPWTNFVDPDPARNHEAGDKWIAWFNKVKDDPDRYTAKNTAQLHSQFLYRKFAQISVTGNTVLIDNRTMPDWAYDLGFLGNLVLKHKLQAGEHISSASLNGGDIACYYEERGFAYIVLPKLEKKQYTLTVTTGTSDMPTYVWNDGTYNVQEFHSGADNAVVSLEMHGTQRVKVKLRFEPQEVTSNNTDLEIKDWRYEAPFLNMLIRGRNIQGEPGVITIRSKPSPEQR